MEEEKNGEVLHKWVVRWISRWIWIVLFIMLTFIASASQILSGNQLH